MAIRLNARARKRFGPLVLNIGARSGIHWSLKAGRFTYSPRRRMLSVNTPGIGSVQVTPGRGRRRTQPAAPPVLLDDAAAQQRRCTTCQSEPGDVCRTKDKRPTRTHRARREMPAEPGLSTQPPLLARLISRLLMSALLLFVAWLAVILHPAGGLLPW